MESRKFRAPHRKTQRRWRVPPAIRRGDEVFEGLGILEEIRTEAGIVLWQALRDALLWAEAPAEERATLFSPEAAEGRAALLESAPPAPEVGEPLAALGALLAHAEDANAEGVAEACREISRWAHETGHLATALAFAQAAATLLPAHPATALTVGRLARRRAEYARAETWCRRSIALARQAGDWGTYAQAFLGLGRMYMQRGNLPAARRHLGRAVRAAQRNSLHDIEGMALHDLFGVAVQAGRVEEARDLARTAFEVYGTGHVDLPRLAQDVAYWWITQGLFARALPVLRSTLPHLPSPSDQLMVRGNLARAAGGMGDRETFGEAWDACFALLAEETVEDRAAQGLLDLAYGAASLALWDRAETAARQALEIGQRRHEAQIRLTAESLIESVRHHRGVEGRKRATQPPAAAAADARLANALVRSLEAAGTA